MEHGNSALFSHKLHPSFYDELFDNLSAVCYHYSNLKNKEAAVLKRISKQSIVLLSIFALCIVLNLLARFCTPFADWYTYYIYHPLADFGSRLSGLIPFSFGIFLPILGILLLVLGIPALIVALIRTKDKEKRRTIRRTVGFFLAWAFAYVTLTETLHCFIMYQQTTLGEREYATLEATPDELLDAYEQVVIHLEELEPQITRTAMGYVKYSGTEEELEAEAVRAMQGLSDWDSRFSGYYPPVKYFLFPEFFRYDGTIGLFTPYTLEANVMPDLSYNEMAVVRCHELAHLKGIILEDEANFIAFRACVESDSVFLQYSGYVSALRYLHHAIITYFNRIIETLEADPTYYDEAFQIHFSEWSERFNDLDFRAEAAYQDAWNYYRFDAETAEELEEEQTEYDDTVLSDETIEVIEDVSDTLTDTSLKINGVSDGMQSYNRMVDLTIQYLKEAAPADKP